jgi:hypothetical protein
MKGPLLLYAPQTKIPGACAWVLNDPGAHWTGGNLLSFFLFVFFFSFFPSRECAQKHKNTKPQNHKNTKNTKTQKRRNQQNARQKLKKRERGGRHPKKGMAMLTVCFAGLPSARKSTMINALAPKRVLESGICRTTTEPCVVG